MKPKLYDALVRQKMHPYRIMALVAINAIHLSTKVKKTDYDPSPDGANSRYAYRLCKKFARVGIQITPEEFNKICGYLQNIKISTQFIDAKTFHAGSEEYYRELRQKAIEGINEILKDLVKE